MPIQTHTRNWLLLLTLTVALPFVASAQTKRINEERQVWLGYFNQTRFSKRWGSWLDLHLRTKENYVNQFSQSMVRAGLTYYVGDLTKFTAGYAYVWHYPADNHPKVTQPEHRPWQQIQWHTNYPRLKTMQWVRLEERLRRNIKNDSTLADGSAFNFRVRYNFLLQFPLTKTKIKAGDFSLILNNEIHLNFGNAIVYNTFDQNRLFAGLALHTSATDNLQVGYMNLFQQLAGGSNYRMLHTARLFYFHNLHWH